MISQFQGRVSTRPKQNTQCHLSPKIQRLTLSAKQSQDTLLTTDKYNNREPEIHLQNHLGQQSLKQPTQIIESHRSPCNTRKDQHLVKRRGSMSTRQSWVSTLHGLRCRANTLKNQQNTRIQNIQWTFPPVLTSFTISNQNVSTKLNFKPRILGNLICKKLRVMISHPANQFKNRGTPTGCQQLT